MNSGSSNRIPSSWGEEKGYRPCLFSDLNTNLWFKHLQCVLPRKKKYLFDGLPRLSRKYWLGYAGFSIVTCKLQSAQPSPTPYLPASLWPVIQSNYGPLLQEPVTRHIESVGAQREGRNRNFQRLDNIGWGQIGHQGIILLTSRNWRKRTPLTF